MRATGVVRRIDDLGRIVIPREIRRQMDLREGDGMEFYTEDNKLVLTKYEQPFEEQPDTHITLDVQDTVLNDFIVKLAEAVINSTEDYDLPIELMELEDDSPEVVAEAIRNLDATDIIKFATQFLMPKVGE